MPQHPETNDSPIEADIEIIPTNARIYSSMDGATEAAVLAGVALMEEAYDIQSLYTLRLDSQPNGSNGHMQPGGLFWGETEVYIPQSQRPTTYAVINEFGQILSAAQTTLAEDTVATVGEEMAHLHQQETGQLDGVNYHPDSGTVFGYYNNNFFEREALPQRLVPLAALNPGKWYSLAADFSEMSEQRFLVWQTEGGQTGVVSNQGPLTSQEM